MQLAADVARLAAAVEALKKSWTPKNDMKLPEPEEGKIHATSQEIDANMEEEPTLEEKVEPENIAWDLIYESLEYEVLQELKQKGCNIEGASVIALPPLDEFCRVTRDSWREFSEPLDPLLPKAIRTGATQGAVPVASIAASVATSTPVLPNKCVPAKSTANSTLCVASSPIRTEEYRRPAAERTHVTSPNQNKKSGTPAFSSNDTSKNHAFIDSQVKALATSNATASLWGPHMYPKKGAWSCGTCLVSNDPVFTTCQSCATPAQK